jgi:hypothetical protein
MVIDQQRGGDIQRPNGQVLTGNNIRGTTSQQRSHPLTTSGPTVCCKTPPKISARQCRPAGRYQNRACQTVPAEAISADQLTFGHDQGI